MLAAAPQPALVEPHSERERGILRRVGLGASNTETAALVIAAARRRTGWGESVGPALSLLMLIPGGILAGLGLAAVTGDAVLQVLAVIGGAWPLGLIAIGLYLLLGRPHVRR